MSNDPPPEALQPARLEGNSAFKRKDYDTALAAYTKAIDLLLNNSATATSPEDNLTVLYSNRSAAYFSSGDFTTALKDAELAVDAFSPTQENATKSSLAKAHYRCGKALCGLGRYEEAVKAFRAGADAAGMQSSKAELCRELAKAEKWVLESQGTYDFPELWRESRKRPNTKLYDHVDYFGPVEVAQVGNGKGRGLIVTEDVEAGRLVKAIALVYDSEVTEKVDRAPGVMTSVTKEELEKRILEAASKNKMLKEEIQQLYAGSHVQVTIPASPEDELTPTPGNATSDDASETGRSPTTGDIPRLSEIISRNGSDISLHPLSIKENPICGTSDVAVGLWNLPSYINHSCHANIIRYTIGDYAFFRSLRRIKKGNEIHFPYCDILNTLETREATLKSHGFVCNCSMCKTERKEPEELVAARKALWERFEKIEPRLRNEPMARKPLNEIKAIVATAKEDHVTKRTDSATLAKLPVPNGLLYKAANACGIYLAGASRTLEAAECFALAAKALCPTGGVHPLSDSTAYFAAQTYLSAGKRVEASKWFEAAKRAWNVAYDGGIDAMKVCYSGTKAGAQGFETFTYLAKAFAEGKLNEEKDTAS